MVHFAEDFKRLKGRHFGGEHGDVGDGTGRSVDECAEGGEGRLDGGTSDDVGNGESCILRVPIEGIVVVVCSNGESSKTLGPLAVLGEVLGADGEVFDVDDVKFAVIERSSGFLD
jgi:hypothetical protein